MHFPLAGSSHLCGRAHKPEKISTHRCHCELTEHSQIRDSLVFLAAVTLTLDPSRRAREDKPFSLRDKGTLEAEQKGWDEGK